MGLVLFDNYKDVGSGTKFGFWQYFGISRGKLGPNMDQTINFAYISFPLKHLILNDCSETVFVL